MRFSSTTPSASPGKLPPPTSRSPWTSPLGCRTSSRSITRSSTKRPRRWTEPDSSYRRISPDHRRLEGRKLSEIKGVARFNLHEGKVEEFKRLSAQAMDIVRAKDTGTLQYEIYFNEDQSECVVYERYRDSEAVIEHGAHVGHLNEAIFATGSVSSELLGEPSAELTAMIAGSGVPLFRPFLSM